MQTVRYLNLQRSWLAQTCLYFGCPYFYRINLLVSNGQAKYDFLPEYEMQSTSIATRFISQEQEPVLGLEVRTEGTESLAIHRGKAHESWDDFLNSLLGLPTAWGRSPDRDGSSAMRRGEMKDESGEKWSSQRHWNLSHLHSRMKLKVLKDWNLESFAVP